MQFCLTDDMHAIELLRKYWQVQDFNYPTIASINSFQ